MTHCERGNRYNIIEERVRLPCTFFLQSMHKYDVIILGAGAAGLSLLMRVMVSSKLQTKKILVIDKERKNANDRTWCFWEKNTGFFEELVFKKWQKLSFHSPGLSSELQMGEYAYKMVRGIDFYRYCFEKITNSSNIEILYGEIKSAKGDGHKLRVTLDDRDIELHAPAIFNSIYDPAAHIHADLQLLQHFKGWVIETPDDRFNSESATLMDFRVHQDHGTSFAYILPLSDTRALVEYTLFTQHTLTADQYALELKRYISDFLKIDEYVILEEEFGIIPMTDAKFNFFHNGMYHIGMAGGQTKPSTGYTFQFIQKQSEHILKALEQNRTPLTISKTPRRFPFYDKVLLKVLLGKDVSGQQVFSKLFERNPASRIFRFLDNESTILDEVRLISTLPSLPFLKAAIF